MLEVFYKLRNYLERIEFPSASPQLLGRLRPPQSSCTTKSLVERGPGEAGSVRLRAAWPGRGTENTGSYKHLTSFKRCDVAEA